MEQFQKESHLRSIIKGISWRITATSATISIVLLITCLTGQCSIEQAIKIGLIEFFLKLGIYYLHERAWQFAYKDGVVTPKESLFKTITWRVIATTTTFIISGTVLEIFNEVALYIALTELFTKFVLYYLHERMWLKLPLGKLRSFFLRSKG